jgi:hypothetical protein
MRIVSLTAIASISAALLASPALADDGKNYPGAFCTGNKTNDDEITRHGSGRVYNETEDALTMICPAVKDEAEIVGATVYVLDGSQGERVTCILRSPSPSSTSGDLWTSSTAPGYFASTPYALTFPRIESTGHGVYVVSCTIPGTNNANFASGIVSYEINETM